MQTLHNHVYRCETSTQQVFRSCRSEVVEQPSSWSATSWH